MGTELPLKSGPASPIVGPYRLWPNSCMDQYTTWHGGRPWPRPHCVRWGPSSTPSKGHSPQFSAHVCCGQTAGWIKTPLCTKVGLGPGHILFYGDPAHPKRGTAPHPIFGPCILWPNGRPSQLLLSTCITSSGMKLGMMRGICAQHVISVLVNFGSLLRGA